MKVGVVTQRQQTILDVQESINRALDTAGHPFCEGDLRRLERLQDQTRRANATNSSTLRESIVQLACVYAGNILFGDYPQPETRYTRELVKALRTLNYADDYLDTVKVRLCLYLALLAQLVEQPDIAQEAAAKAVHRSHHLNPVRQGTAWLVYSEINSQIGTQLDQSGALQMALAAFKRMPLSKLKLLMLLRTRGRLASHYRFFGRPFYSRWHTWCNRNVRRRLMNEFHGQSNELEKACTNRVPPTLRDI